MIANLGLAMMFIVAGTAILSIDDNHRGDFERTSKVILGLLIILIGMALLFWVAFAYVPSRSCGARVQIDNVWYVPEECLGENE